jgi:tetratricopeptide (TPR) repeat protein
MIAALLAALLAAAPESAPSRFEAANAAYLAGDFAQAAGGYEAILADGWESPTLHLNLGNARLRLGRRGLAAASYERALRLDPLDADARANLALARSANVDRVLGAADRPFLTRLVERIPDAAATAAFAAAWLLLWAALALRRRAPGRVRPPLAALAIAAALAAAATGALLAGRASALGIRSAVVIAPSSPVREGPEEALRPAFELHEGTRIRVLEVRGAMARIRLENGLEGWIAVRDLEPI